MDLRWPVAERLLTGQRTCRPDLRSDMDCQPSQATSCVDCPARAQSGMPRDLNQCQPYRYFQLRVKYSGDSSSAKLHRPAYPVRSIRAAGLVSDSWLTPSQLQCSD